MFSTKFAWKISNSKKNLARYDQKVYRYLCKVTLLVLDFNETWILPTDLKNILKYQIWWKSLQWEPNSYMRTDRQRDMKKLTDGFPNFTKAPENICTVSNYVYTTCQSTQ